MRKQNWPGFLHFHHSIYNVTHFGRRMERLSSLVFTFLTTLLHVPSAISINRLIDRWGESFRWLLLFWRGNPSPHSLCHGDNWPDGGPSGHRLRHWIELVHVGNFSDATPVTFLWPFHTVCFGDRPAKYHGYSRGVYGEPIWGRIDRRDTPILG